MDSPTNLPVEEQVKRLAAMPRPRPVHPIRKIPWIITLPLLLALVALGVWREFFSATSHQPMDLFGIVFVALLIAMRGGVGGSGWTDLFTRNLLQNGTPAVGRVLSNE